MHYTFGRVKYAKGEKKKKHDCVWSRAPQDSGEDKLDSVKIPRRSCHTFLSPGGSPETPPVKAQGLELNPHVQT